MKQGQRPIRVAFCIDSFGVGGTELNAVRLAEAFDPAECTLAVCHLTADGPLRPRYEALGTTLRHVSIPNLYSPSTVLAGARLARWLREWRADVLHTHDIYSNIFASPWGRLRGGCGVLASRRWWYDAPRPGLIPLNRWSYRFAHRVLANSPGVADLLRREERVPAAKVVEIPNFLGESAFQAATPQERRERRQAWGVPDDAFVIGIVARLAPVKNHAMLLQAMALLPGRGHLVIVGDGPSRGILEQMAADLHLSSRVTFLGQVVSEVNIQRYFDASVLCSHSEGFPNSVIEALAAVRPVIATPVGGVTDIISAGATGLLVPLGDAQALATGLQTLMADPELGARLGKAGQDRVRALYHQDIVVGQLISLYRQLAASR